MTATNTQLPQLEGGLFITDGGLETTLVFIDGMDLPEFAAYGLLTHEKGRQRLRDYFKHYLEVAAKEKAGFILETPTWRANSDWGSKLGHSSDQLDSLNRAAVEFLEDLRRQHQTTTGPMVISGCIGPRGDGYIAGEAMSVEEAAAYHLPQLKSFAAAGADMAAAITMTNIEEATGIAVAAERAGLPVAISFTVETDGRLPSGAALSDAIKAVDQTTSAYPAYFMLNCAHPSHFEHLFNGTEDWMTRIRGIRANASRCSHAELDDATELDDGNPAELGAEYAALCRRLPHVNVLGGCCGTDHRHVAHIGAACSPLFAAR